MTKILNNVDLEKISQTIENGNKDKFALRKPMHLNLALNALGRGTSAADDDCDDGVTVGGTSPCNDYDADDEGA